MTNSIPAHEKMLSEISQQLQNFDSDLIEVNTEEIMPESTKESDHSSAKFGIMQDQMKRFNSELKDTQQEFKEKIKALGNVTYSPESVDGQIRQLAEQLASERSHNSKLSSDLAKSLELCLQLQLEIQGLKSRSMQIQNEEKKYSQALLEKNKILQRDLELNQALKDETSMELAKAKNAFMKEQENWVQMRNRYEADLQAAKTTQADMIAQIEDLSSTIQKKEQQISTLNGEIAQVQKSFQDVDASADQQQDVLKNLMEVAEGKIVEMKMLLDKKSVEAQDYYSHLQQALTQTAVLKQENAALKDYINKLNMYHQQTQQMMQNQNA